MIDEKKLIEELQTLADKESKKCEEAAEANLADVAATYNHGEICYQNAVETVNSQPKIGGWIPCSERLPEECENVLVWYEYFRYGDYNCMFQTYGIGYHVEGHWRGDVNGAKARCIAWQPLPEPYHE